MEKSVASVKKNFMYSTIYNLLALIIPFITTPYISRVLGPDGIGAYSYTYSIAYYFVLFSMLGLTKYGNRTIAEVRENKEKLNQTFSEIYAMQLLTGMISTMIYICCVIFVFDDYQSLFSIQFIYVASATFDISWFFFGIEQFKTTVIRNIAIRVLNVLCLFLFVKTKNDVTLYCLVMALSTFLTHISLWPILLKEYIQLQCPTISGVLKHVRMNLILFVPTIAVSFYKMMDKIMIGSIINTVEVGYYENAEKIINIPMSLVTALGTVMLPRMTYIIATGNQQEERRYNDITMSFMLWVTCAMSCGIVAISEAFVPVFLGKEFSASIRIVNILAPTMVFISWGNTLGSQILIPRKKDVSYIVIVIIGVLTNLSLNLILIPMERAYGAAIATLITEVIVMVGYSIAGHQHFEWRKNLFLLVLYGAIGLSMTAIVQILINFQTNAVINIVAKIFVGAVYYSTVSSVASYLFNRAFFDFMYAQLKKVLHKKS